MTPETLTQRLRLGEDSRTEFKSTAHDGLDRKNLAREIAAFANGGGGQIFLGVEDDGTPTGVGTIQQADAMMCQVVQACQTMVHPAIWCPVMKVEVEGKLVLIVDVPASSPDRPYRAEHIFYIRDASMSREARRDELLRMLQSQNIHHDETSVEGSTQEDLDLEAIDALLRAAYAPGAPAQRSHYLRALKCIDDGGIPTVAGVLLFGREPERWFTDARISAVRWRGTRMSGDLADRQEIHGHLVRQIDGAIAFLARHVPAPARIEGFERVELGIPEVVLREAVLNAVAHRDYRAASQIRIFVFDDRLEIINPGLLLNHLTLDSIRLGGISQRRNPVIAAALARLRGRESLGMGVPEMVERMRERGLPEPELSLEGGHFRVVLRAAPAEGGGA